MKKWQSANVVFILCTVIGAATAAATAQCAPILSKIPTRGGYVKFCHYSRVIVFVHGYTSNPEVWRNQETGNYWPTLIAEDPSPIFRDTDVYVVGYDTPSSGGKMTMGDLVTEILNRMDHANVFSDHREVVFIAHSMGGLLTQELLLTYAADHNLAPKIARIFLYGTPLEGSSVANLVKFFKSDPLIKELQAGGDNFILQSLDQRWLHSNFSQTKRFCAYEIKREHGFKVVDRYSATRGCSDQQAIDVDHHHLVEPEDRDSDAYIFVSNHLGPVSTQAASDAGPIPDARYAAPSAVTIAAMPTAAPVQPPKPRESTVAKVRSSKNDLWNVISPFYPDMMIEHAQDRRKHPEQFGGTPLTPEQLDEIESGELQGRFEREKYVQQDYTKWATNFELVRQDAFDCLHKNSAEVADDDVLFRSANGKAAAIRNLADLKKDDNDTKKLGPITSYVNDLLNKVSHDSRCGR